MRFGRIAAVVFVAVLLAAEVTRLTVVSRVADDNPELALRLAQRSPDALASIGMAEIGNAAARGANPDEATLDRFRTIAGAAPLRLEPFLVAAALAERTGDLTRARSLLTQARLRNPRSVPALYLLADVSVRQNKVAEGLEDLAVLARLLPTASVQLIPSLAEFARAPGAEEQIARILAANPELKSPVLDTLSADPNNAKLVLALAGPDSRSLDDHSKIWKSRLVNAIIASGDYRGAYQVWHNFAGLPGDAMPLLFNGGFRKTPAPAPFDWSYISGAAGVVEPADGKLRVLYYGREDSALASQLLLLQAGTYRFEAPIIGSAVAGALVWRLTCQPSGQTPMNFPVGSAAVALFTVPEGCSAQTLSLTGVSLDRPQITDVQIGPVRLERSGS